MELTKLKEFEVLSQTALFWMDQSWYDDHPERAFATSVSIKEDCLEINFQSFHVNFLNSWGGEAEPLYCLGKKTRLCTFNFAKTTLFWLSPGKQIYYGNSGIDVDDALRAKLSWTDKLLIAIDPWDKSDLLGQQFINDASQHLSGLYEIQDSKGYKQGWVYYRFTDYISQSAKGKYCFPQSFKGNTWAALMALAEAGLKR